MMVTSMTEIFWTQVGHAYGYRSDEPDFEDFAITLFQSAYSRVFGEDAPLTSTAPFGTHCRVLAVPHVRPL